MKLVGGIPTRTYPSEKYESMKVSWDYDIPNMMGKSHIKAMFQTTNQGHWTEQSSFIHRVHHAHWETRQGKYTFLSSVWPRSEAKSDEEYDPATAEAQVFQVVSMKYDPAPLLKPIEINEIPQFRLGML